MTNGTIPAISKNKDYLDWICAHFQIYRELKMIFGWLTQTSPSFSQILTDLHMTNCIKIQWLLLSWFDF